MMKRSISQLILFVSFNSARRLSRIIRCLLCLLLLTPMRAFALGELILDNQTLTTTQPTTIPENVLLEGADTINTDGVNDAISGVIEGSGRLTETGGGTLTLSGSNTYTGGTTVEGGSTLEIGSAANLGNASGTLTLNNGTLETTASATLSENISLGSSGSDVINTDGSNDTLSGVISGSGGLTETGGGTLTLTGSNTYSGGTTIEGGSTLEIGSATNLGSASGGLTLNNGTLETTAGITTSENISLGLGG